VLNSLIITVSDGKYFSQNPDPQVRMLAVAVLTRVAEIERILLKQITGEKTPEAKLQEKHIYGSRRRKRPIENQ